MIARHWLVWYIGLSVSAPHSFGAATGGGGGGGEVACRKEASQVGEEEKRDPNLATSAERDVQPGRRSGLLDETPFFRSMYGTGGRSQRRNKETQRFGMVGGVGVSRLGEDEEKRSPVMVCQALKYLRPRPDLAPPSPDPSETTLLSFGEHPR